MITVNNNYNHKSMWCQKSVNSRASRVAIAGSIYMRRASLQANKPKQINNENLENTSRAPSYGKIVKNYGKKTQTSLPDQITNYSRRVGTPLLNRNDFISPRLGVEIARKTPTPSFGHFDSFENSKVKAIQQKYKSMLSDYQNKKKSINNQLASLKSSTHITTGIKPRQSEIKTGIFSTKNVHRPNDNILREYEEKTKQLIIEKIGGASKPAPLKKKQKVSNLYPSFFKAIKTQILLEEQLRVIRSSVNAQKKPEIEKILLENQEFKNLKLLDLDPEEFDPFDNKKTSDTSAAALANKLIQKHKECESNWKQIVCKTNRKQAREIFDCLNFEKAQEISLKSFVRQMSFLLQKHLRNRDLLRIYNRLVPFTHHNFCLVVSDNTE